MWMDHKLNEFQWAPTLGGECYRLATPPRRDTTRDSFNGHPPLGVNATTRVEQDWIVRIVIGFNGHPPLGVNATV